MVVKIVKRIYLAIAISLAVQTAYGMSGGRGWEFMPLGTPEQIPLPHLEEQRASEQSVYQALLAQAQIEPNPIVKRMLRNFAEIVKGEHPQTAASSSSSSSPIPVGSKRKREDALDKGKEPEEEESQQPPQVKAPKKESREESEQEIQKLLKNEMTIFVDQFTQTNLKALKGLDKVGVLTILPKVGGRIPDNLIKLIEQHFPNILSLRLSKLNMGRSKFKKLVESTVAARLKELSIKECNIKAQVFTRENIDRFESLEKLDVFGNPIGDVGFKALAKSDIAAQLRVLNVSGCDITAQSFTSENINQFKSLESLNVSYNLRGAVGLVDEGFKALAKSDIAAQLRVLDVSWCGITAESFTSENINQFKRLEWLNVSYNRIRDVGFEALAKSDIAAQLRVLDVRWCGVTAQGFTSANFNKFKILEELSINDSLLPDQANILKQANILAAIMHSDICQTLQKLDGLSEEVAKEFNVVCRVKSR